MFDDVAARPDERVQSVSRCQDETRVPEVCAAFSSVSEDGDDEDAAAAGLLLRIGVL